MVQATHSDISTLCGQNLLLWMQYLELVTFNKMITHQLAKEHHVHRVFLCMQSDSQVKLLGYHMICVHNLSVCLSPCHSQVDEPHASLEDDAREVHLPRLMRFYLP